MISESSLKRICSAAVFSRACHVADRGLRLHKRKCRYDGPETILTARVDASYSWDGAYRTLVVLDEDADAVVDYDCDCPAARRFAGPCKHAVALVLDYNDRPEDYDGHDPRGHRTTSRSVMTLIERASEHEPMLGGVSTEQEPGTVGFELTLAYEVGFEARFRLLGSYGSYVLKSITEFEANMEARAYRSYGKRLAFTHVPEAFSDRGMQVADFLVRAVQNRRAYSLQRAMGRGAFGTGTSLPIREMQLSAPELWELLDLYDGATVLFEDRSGASRGQVEATPLRVRRGDPSLRLDLRPLEDGSFEVVRPQGVRIVASAGAGAAIAWDKTSLYRCTPALADHVDLLSVLLGDPAAQVVVAERDLDRFCALALPRLEEAVPVGVPKELEALRPAPCRLEFRLDYGPKGATCLASATYGDRSVALMGSRGMRDEDADLVRDAQAEARGRQVVRRYFSVSDGGDLLIADKRGDALATLVFEGVPELQRVGTVFVTPAFERLRSTTRPRVRVGMSVRSNLLDLSFDMQGVTPADLAGLLTSYRLRRRYHRLRDGSFVSLEGADLGEADVVLGELGLTARQLESGSATVPAYRAFLLDAVVSDEDKDASFDEYLDRIRTVDLTAYKVPASLEGVLRPYQVEGFRWLSGLADLGLGGILADEMGLGKSVQLIAFLLARRSELRTAGPAMVVCPASLVYNWQAEFSKFAPQMAVSVVAGTADERRQTRLAGTADVLVTSYDLLRRDVEDYAHMRVSCLALDEAQYIKNHETLAARAVKAVRAQHCVALTGTPVENRLSELWSIFDFLMPGLLGSYERFRDRYERPIVEGQDAEVAERLRRAVRPFVLRRLKRDVMADLPEKIEEVVYAHMGDRQRSLYVAQAQAIRAQLAQSTGSLGRERMQVLAGLMRLRQICCDPRLVFEGYDEGSCKTDTILTLVQRVVDAREKLLVFSQFTSYLDVISSELGRLGIDHYTITGATPKRRRLELVDAFNADDTPVFLISLKAGGTGLNLTGATVVIHADPWWNAAAQNQATDRAHRIGQTHDVTVYKVIAADTVEDRILELQQTKTQLADAVVEGDVSGGSLAQLTREDLEDLLG